MIKWLEIVAGTLRSLLRSQRELALENLVLPQQLAVLKQRRSRPCRSDVDRLFWVLLSSVWSGWRKCLHIVQPETVIRWHRQGSRYYRRWKGRGHGRPKIDPEIPGLVQRMCRANPLWGAPQSPWQNPYAERVIGSIRREYLDHMIILDDLHLKRILANYAEYYHSVRTHLSLEKDTPLGRPIQSPEQGKIVELKRVGRLHHEYVRMAA